MIILGKNGPISFFYWQYDNWQVGIEQQKYTIKRLIGAEVYKNHECCLFIKKKYVYYGWIRKKYNFYRHQLDGQDKMDMHKVWHVLASSSHNATT